MAFEIAPLKQPIIAPQDPDNNTKRHNLAKQLYKKGAITLQDASLITGIRPEEIERQEIQEGSTILVCGGAGFIGSNFVR